MVLFLIISRNENKTIDALKFNMFIRLSFNIIQFTSYFNLIKFLQFNFPEASLAKLESFLQIPGSMPQMIVTEPRMMLLLLIRIPFVRLLADSHQLTFV